MSPDFYDLTMPLAKDDDKDDDDKGAGKGLYARLLKNRTVMVSKPIDRDLMERFSSALLLMEADDPDKPITVIVNSPGGDADSGFAMYDMLRFIRPPIRSICAGLAASAGVPVFLGGDQSQRYSLPNSRFLLHQPSMQAMGQASDVEITANEIVKIRDKYNHLVAGETGRSAKEIEEDCNRDFWLSAQEAVEYGLVTRIVMSRKDIE